MSAVAGEFRCGDGEPVQVDGFCDSQDGRVFRIRFMPRSRVRISTRSRTGKAISRRNTRARSRLVTAAAAGWCGSIPSTPGIFSGRDRRALLLERYDDVFSDGLGRPDDPRQPGPAAPTEGQSRTGRHHGPGERRTGLDGKRVSDRQVHVPVEPVGRRASGERRESGL